MDLNTALFFNTLKGNKKQPQFSPEQIETLRDLIKRKQDSNYAREQTYFPKSEEKYNQFPTYKDRNGQLERLPYSDYRAEKEAKLATYDKTRNKISIDYSDYGHDLGGVDGTGWLDHFRVPPNNHNYQLATSLGRFNAYDNGDHYLIDDEYSWNPVDEKFSLGTLFTMLKSPQALGNTLGRIFDLKGPHIKLKVPK